MAQIFAGIYPDRVAAEQMIYDLVKAGIPRHTIAVSTEDELVVRNGALDPEHIKEVTKNYQKYLHRGKVLVITWTFAGWIDKARHIMKYDYEPILFEKIDTQ